MVKRGVPAFFDGRQRRPKHNRSNMTARAERRLMLDSGKERLFHFDLEELLATIANKDAASSLEGNITTKAGRMGIDEAVKYVERLVDEKILTMEESKRIVLLLERYGVWR
jgi:hypothetical protein